MSSARLIFDDKDRVGDWVAERVGQRSSWGDFYAMGAERGGELTAGIVFNSMTECNATTHIAVDRANQAFVQLLDHGFVYAFQTCGLLRLTGLVEASNTKALKLDAHIGFEPESVMRCAGSGGQDIIVLVLWPQNYYRVNRNGW